ncbi:MAG: TIGR01777 family oxidoreductase [Desulfovibrionaceae bacterium]
MRVVVVGGTGFIGKALCAELLRKGFAVDVVSRNPAKAREIFGPEVRGVSWSLGEQGGLGEAVENAGGIVNLAGESIMGRWTGEKKRRILSSRLKAVESVVRAVEQAGSKPRVLLQGSAVGYYGPRGKNALDESAEVGKGFLADTARQWEQASAPVEVFGVRRALLRTGMVLGDGGALARMLPIFRLGLGGPVGSGEQMVSWIHLQDEVGAIIHLLEHEDASGPFNLTAPGPVTNREFALALGRVLSRPAGMPAPGFAVRLMFGEMADEVLLSGQAALPSGLLNSGYAFAHPEVEEALRNAAA